MRAPLRRKQRRLRPQIKPAEIDRHLPARALPAIGAERAALDDVHGIDRDRPAARGPARLDIPGEGDHRALDLDAAALLVDAGAADIDRAIDAHRRLAAIERHRAVMARDRARLYHPGQIEDRKST